MFHSTDFDAASETVAATSAALQDAGPRNRADNAAASAEGSLLRRPRLLARAAREGARMYRRERDLTGALPGMTGPRRGGDIVSRLLGIEAQIDEDRRAGAAGYSARRHVQILSALVAESMALAEARKAD
ncbi:DUF6477 family protein [Rhodovulum sp. DZ06]|uniref:DUF6477 family protein n=1 Tax=Rhodovulum sp. DZ06 TaxID=3425126 RepID=UPI003D34E3AE